MIERTLVLVKPDGVRRALIGTIISRLELTGLKVVAMKMLLPDKALAGNHYAADPKWFEDTGNKTLKSYRDKGIILDETAVQVATRIRNYIIEYLSTGPVAALVLEGNDAIYVTRKLCGATEPKAADASTIRGSLSSDSYELSDTLKRPLKNLIHASEDKKTAEREIGVWFTEEEIIEYKRGDEGTLY
jgi:nucleoside-diphosphate kinase